MFRAGTNSGREFVVAFVQLGGPTLENRVLGEPQSKPIAKPNHGRQVKPPAPRGKSLVACNYEPPENSLNDCNQLSKIRRD